MTAPERSTIVVIDADPARRGALVELLRRAGARRYDAIEVDTLDAALPRCRAAGPDAPVCALVGDPERDAPALRSALATTHDAPACPVLLVGDLDPEARIAALRAGAQDCLDRATLTAAGLDRAIEHAIERWRAALVRGHDTAARRRAEQRLAVEHAVSRILAHATGLDDAIPAVLRALLDGLGMDLCELWLPGPDGRVRCFDAVAVDPGSLRAFLDEGARLAFSPGAGLPGRVYQSREPVWIESLATDDDFTRSASAAACGLRTGVGTPLLGGGGCLGVIEWFRRASAPCDPDLLATLAALGAEIGQFILRKRTEAVLRDSEARFRLAMRAVHGVVWEWDLHTDHVLRSEGLLALVGVRPEDAPPEHAWWLARVHPDDLARLGGGRALLDGDTFACEYRVRHADGRWIHLWEHAVIERDAAGQVARVVGFTADIGARVEMEQSLREARNQLALALEAAVAVAFTWDIRRDVVRRLHSTSAALPATRDPAETFATMCARVHPDDRAAFEANVLRALAAGDDYVNEYRATLPDGGFHWFSERGRVERDADGHPLRLIGLSIDVTRGKQAETALAERNTLLRSVLESTTDAVFSKDLEGRYLLINRASARLLGTTPEAAVGKFDVDLMPAELAAALRSHDRVIVESGASQVFEETILVDRRPQVFHTLKAPLRDPAGRIVGLLGMARDITERKRAEEAVRASEQRFRALADAMPQVVWVADETGRVLYCNRRVDAFAGAPGEGEPWDWRSAIHPDDLAATEAAWQTALASRRPYQAEHRLRMKDGAHRWHLSRGTPIAQPGGGVTWYLTATDVHDLKTAQEALKDADRRKDEFLATLAHELRNPLAPIRNGLEILRMVAAGPAAERARAMMERQFSHLVHLVDDLLDVSRVSRGKITLRPERIGLREVVDAAVEACRPAIDARGHALHVALPERPLVLLGDRTRLTQILANLLTNAAKYTEPGGEIRVHAAQDGDCAVLQVTDTGVGIPREALPTIWDMFTQARGDLHRAQGGLGIGLSLVKKLVEMHGGAVQATSAGPGAGSTFTVRLPLAPDAPAPVPEVLAQQPCPDGRRVLVVDDNVDAADTLAMMLELLGHATATAHDGPSALAAARRLRPDVVFLDIGLPGISGYEVAARLREDPTTADATIVALTGWGTDEDRRRSAAAGFDQHLTKPVDLSRVQEAMARSERRRAASDAPTS